MYIHVDSCEDILDLPHRTFVDTVKSRLYVQVGTQKVGRRTERDVQVKIIFRITPCEVFWMRLNELDVQTSGTYN